MHRKREKMKIFIIKNIKTKEQTTEIYLDGIPKWSDDTEELIFKAGITKDIEIIREATPK